LLELAVREAPDDPRASFHLGRELYDAKRFTEAGQEFERYFTLPPSNVEAERSAALRYLAHCREELGDGDEALTMFRQAAERGPALRGAWVELAWACHRRQHWPECLAAAERAIAFPGEARGYGDETAPGVVPEDIACMAAWALGRTNEALSYARTAATKAPLNARIRANLKRIEAALKAGGSQAFGVSMTPIEQTPTPQSGGDT
jgi:tetratricopeptide (TPR) repeat protein